MGPTGRGTWLGGYRCVCHSHGYLIHFLLTSKCLSVCPYQKTLTLALNFLKDSNLLSTLAFFLPLLFSLFFLFFISLTKGETQNVPFQFPGPTLLFKVSFFHISETCLTKCFTLCMMTSSIQLYNFILVFGDLDQDSRPQGCRKSKIDSCIFEFKLWMILTYICIHGQDCFSWICQKFK